MKTKEQEGKSIEEEENNRILKLCWLVWRDERFRMTGNVLSAFGERCKEAHGKHVSSSW